MDPERWQVLEPLLDQALDLSAEDRVKWLEQLRARSPDLAEELTAFLSQQGAADQHGFLVEQFDVTLAGLELGAYRLERPLGQGGMGTVWLARRIDGRFEGVAAVKLLNLSLLTPNGLERFRREGSTLSRLTHPGIARLLDAGVSPTGQPYLILDHVDGQPIDVYVRTHNLGIADRVRLFSQVLAAVAHAHANLIVHRDIKPSNILVTTDGSVKLLDFGIAKLLDDEGMGEQSLLTAEGAGALTPKYAAPEQLRGEPVTTATDVYALGVLLYLMLSDRHPTAEGRHTPADTIRGLFEVEPAPLRLGDLDTIVLKALRKSPAERYQTVATFGDDLDRYLRGEPVSARGHSVVYRMGKFVGRHRAGVIAGALTVAGLILATVFSLAQRNEARRQRDAALREAGRAEGVLMFQTQLFSLAYAQPMTTKQLLDRGLSLFGQPARANPANEADEIMSFAQLYYTLGDMAISRTLIARADSIAAAAGDAPAHIRIQCFRAKVLAEADQVDSAQSKLNQFEQLGRAQGQLDLRITGGCLDAQATLLVARDQRDSAIVVWQRAQGLLEAAGLSLSRSYLGIVSKLSNALFRAGRIRESIAVKRRSIAAHDSVGHAGTVLQIGEIGSLAFVLMAAGEVAEAESLNHQLVPFRNDSASSVKDRTTTATDLGSTSFLMGRADTALLWFTRLVDLSLLGSNAALKRSALFGRGRSEVVLGRLPAARRTLAALRGVRDSAAKMSRDELHLLGWIRSAEGNPKGADSALTAVLVRDGYFTGATNPGARRVLLKAAEVALELGDTDRALKLAGDARTMATIDSVANFRSLNVGDARTIEGRALLVQGDTAAARATLEQAHVALRVGGGPDHPRTREVEQLLASLQQ
jgi:hypothetical protein